MLLVAEYGGVPDQKGLDPRRVSPMALVALSNRIRPAAPKTFRYFAEQGGRLYNHPCVYELLGREFVGLFDILGVTAL